MIKNTTYVYIYFIYRAILAATKYAAMYNLYSNRFLAYKNRIRNQVFHVFCNGNKKWRCSCKTGIKFKRFLVLVNDAGDNVQS